MSLFTQPDGVLDERSIALVEDMMAANKVEMAKLEQVKKRGDRRYLIANIYTVIGLMVIISLLMYSAFAKQDLLQSNKLTKSNAQRIDGLQLVCYGMFFLTLCFALTLFVIMYKQHQMRIKKRQLIVSFFCGLFACMIGVL